VRKIRRKILISIGLLAVYRLFAQIPIPGINREVASLALALGSKVSEGIGGTLFILDVFTGGGISTFSVLTVGIYGYLIAQLFVNVAFNQIPRMRRELALFPYSARERINRWTSFLSVVVTIPIAYGLLNLYRGGFALCLAGYPDAAPIQIGLNGTRGIIIAILAITAGAKFTEWLAGRLSEYGVRGGGTWLIVAVNILAAIPKGVSRLWSDPQWRWLDLGVFAATTIVAVLATLFVFEARRDIPINYQGRRTDSSRRPSYQPRLPLRVSISRQQPFLLIQELILLLSIVSLPFLCSGNQGLRGFAGNVIEFFDFSNPWLWLVYFVLTAAFTFFYNDVVREAQKYGERLRRTGVYILGIRPGRETEQFITRIVRQITLPGSVALGLLVVLPFLVNWLVGASVFLFAPMGLIMVVIAIRNSIYALETEAMELGYYD
jgi:preprotein translocase subunit SecY